MAVGRTTTKAELDQIAGNLSYEIESWSNKVIEMVRFFGDYPADADLVNAFGWSQDEVTKLRAAMTDMYMLSQIRAGQRTQATAKDFRVSTRKLHGPVL